MGINHHWPYVDDKTKTINQVLEQWWLAKNPNRHRWTNINKYMIINNNVEEVKEITVHSFTMGDVEDPDLYAAQPLWEWEKSDNGQWVMEHAMEPPVWYRETDPISWGYKYVIRAKLFGPALTEWLLKNGK